MAYKLPPKALKIINEYSKPLTHPYWRFGTSHALLLKRSNIMRRFANNLHCVIKQDVDRSINNFGENIIYITKETPFNEVIQTYGEEIFQLFSEQFYNDKADSIYSNFFSFIRWYLKRSKRLVPYRYIYNCEENYSYEWVKK